MNGGNSAGGSSRGPTATMSRSIPRQTSKRAPLILPTPGDVNALIRSTDYQPVSYFQRHGLVAHATGRHGPVAHATESCLLRHIIPMYPGAVLLFVAALEQQIVLRFPRGHIDALGDFADG